MASFPSKFKAFLRETLSSSSCAARNPASLQAAQTQESSSKVSVWNLVALTSMRRKLIK